MAGYNVLLVLCFSPCYNVLLVLCFSPCYNVLLVLCFRPPTCGRLQCSVGVVF